MAGSDGGTKKKGPPDINSPFYIHALDYPKQMHVNDTLTDINYTDWSQEMLNFLFAKNKVGFIDGLTKEQYHSFLKHFVENDVKDGSVRMANMAGKRDWDSDWVVDSGNLKISENGDHHRQGRRFAAGGNGHDGHDPRDVEIERLRQRVRELEINPFDRYERQYEDTPTDTTVEEYENEEILEFEGRLCPDDFLDWLRTVDRIFDLRDTRDHIKGSLHTDISDVVYLQQYYSFHDACRLALKVEKQISAKQKTTTRSGSFSHAPQSATGPVRVSPIKADPPALTGVSPTLTTSLLRCFKCQGIGHLKRDFPNKHVLTLIDEADPLYDTEDEVETEVVYPDRGELLVTCRLLNTVVLDQDDNTTWLRTNIFRTQCTAMDELWCEVIPMDACYILLGRPWLYDRRVKHDGYRNTYTFKKDGVSIMLPPLNPKDAPPDRVLISKTDFVGLVKVSPPSVVFGLLMIEENPITVAAPLSMVPVIGWCVPDTLSHGADPSTHVTIRGIFQLYYVIPCTFTFMIFPEILMNLHDMLYLRYPCFTCSAVFVITYIPDRNSVVNEPNESDGTNDADEQNVNPTLNENKAKDILSETLVQSETTKGNEAQPDILRSSPESKETEKFSGSRKAFLAAIASGNEPKNFNQAVEDERWKEALKKEIRALEENDTWTLVDLPNRKHFTSSLLELGFKQCKADYSLFIFKKDAYFVEALIYVDDVIMVGNDVKKIQHTKEELDERFIIKDLGALKYFLGIEVARTSEGLVLSQRKRSRTGYLLLFGGAPISWKTKKQNVVLHGRPMGEASRDSHLDEPVRTCFF
nr:reverse transcriptase domain-containing protein [Tanacetum cinerariifolium]